MGATPMMHEDGRCDLCGAALPVHGKGHTGGVGYATVTEWAMDQPIYCTLWPGAKLCYPCSADLTRRDLVREGAASSI